MKIILTIIMIISFLNADIEIQQNIRALYKGVELTDIQKEYLIDNHDENIRILKESLEKEVKKLKVKYLDEKNVVSFDLRSDGTIGKIRFLKRSDNNKLDKSTKIAINSIRNKLVKPNEDMKIRFIISYGIGQSKVIKEKYQDTINNTKRNIIIPISNGTTRFQHDSNEYVREFTTRKDGFINLSVKPYACAYVKLLTKDNQKIRTGMLPYDFNVEIMRGTYKILIKTKKTCDVSLQYL